jgi:hypothetical protein
MPPYGDKFRNGEVLLIYFRGEPTFYARVESIVADKKKGWWQMTFLVLSLPPHTMIWILDDDQIRGAEFTMGGNALRIERVVAPTPEQAQANPPSSPLDATQDGESGARIVSMFGDEE